MAPEYFARSHNMIAFLKKPKEATGFEQIIDFLNAHPLRYALTAKPVIYVCCMKQFWSTAKTKTIGEEVQIHGSVHGMQIIITEASIRRDLLLDDADGVVCLDNDTIFETLPLLGYGGELGPKLKFFKPLFSPQWKFLIHTILQCLSPKTTSWNEFSTNIASFVICVALNKKFNLSKMIFDGLVKNLLDTHAKYYIYPRFLQLLFDNRFETPPKHSKTWPVRCHTQKLMSHMRRQGNNFDGTLTPLFPHMVLLPQNLGEGSGSPSESQNTPGRFPSTSQTNETSAESISSGTSSADEPTQAENMGDLSVHGRQEMRSAHLEDSPQSGVNTIGRQDSGLILNKLVEKCDQLCKQVCELTKKTSAQHADLKYLNRKFKRLEKKKAGTTKIKRLVKVRKHQVVESFLEEASCDHAEDTTKQGRRTEKNEDGSGEAAVAVEKSVEINTSDHDVGASFEPQQRTAVKDVDGSGEAPNVVEKTVETNKTDHAVGASFDTEQSTSVMNEDASGEAATGLEETFESSKTVEDVSVSFDSKRRTAVKDVDGSAEAPDVVEKTVETNTNVHDVGASFESEQSTRVMNEDASGEATIGLEETFESSKTVEDVSVSFDSKRRKIRVDVDVSADDANAAENRVRTKKTAEDAVAYFGSKISWEDVFAVNAKQSSGRTNWDPVSAAGTDNSAACSTKPKILSEVTDACISVYDVAAGTEKATVEHDDINADVTAVINKYFTSSGNEESPPGENSEPQSVTNGTHVTRSSELPFSNDAAKDLVGHMTDVTTENTTVKETTDAGGNGQPETAASVAATTAATTSATNGATTSITTQTNVTQTNAVNEQGNDAPTTILNKGTAACAYVSAGATVETDAELADKIAAYNVTEKATAEKTPVGSPNAKDRARVKRKRKADVVARQEAALEHWHYIRSTAEADEILAFRMQNKEIEILTCEQAKEALDQIVIERQKFYIKKRAQERIRKPPTKKEQKIFMCEYLERMGGHKVNVLRRLTYDKVKEMFEKCRMRPDKLTPMNKGTGERDEGSSKRAFDDLEQDQSKRQRIDPKQRIERLNRLIVLDTTGQRLGALQPTITNSARNVYLTNGGTVITIKRSDGLETTFNSLGQLLHTIDREDLETVWQCVKIGFQTGRDAGCLGVDKWYGMKCMFEPDIEDVEWKETLVTSWRLYEQCGVHVVTTPTSYLFMLDDADYPLTPTLACNMLFKKLTTNRISEVAYVLVEKIEGIARM